MIYEGFFGGAIYDPVLDGILTFSSQPFHHNDVFTLTFFHAIWAISTLYDVFTNPFSPIKRHSDDLWKIPPEASKNGKFLSKLHRSRVCQLSIGSFLIIITGEVC